MTNAPDGYHDVAVWIISPDTAALLDFAAAAFGAQEVARVADDNGVIGHAEFRIGDTVVLAFDSVPGTPPTPAFLRLYVADCDAAFAAALAAGGSAHTEPTTAPFGDRVARVHDPLGNLWWIHQRVEDVPLAEFERRMGEERWVEAMAYLQGRGRDLVR